MTNNENIIQTPFGIFAGIDSATYYEDGQVKDLRLNEKNMVVTHAGELIPVFSDDTPRRKFKPSVSFFPEGTVKAVYLEEQQEIQTPIGEFPAELVTFYSSGELKRFFPLDGKISGFWSEEDERALNIPFTFELDFTSFSAMLSGVCFYKDGDIRSITLFPGEVIQVKTKNYGLFSVKNGFSMYESGELSSFEPSEPSAISTPIGKINAFDVNSVGINADSNSVMLDKEGRILSLITSGDRFAVKDENGSMVYIVPKLIRNPLSEDDNEIIPIKIQFDYENNSVTFNADETYTFDTAKCYFQIISGSATSCNPADCANCSLCGGK